MAEQQISTHGIDGMTCAHCVMSIDEALRGLPGVTDVQVDLVAGGTSTATVTSTAPLDAAAVDAVVEDAGYSLSGR